MPDDDVFDSPHLGPGKHKSGHLSHGRPIRIRFVRRGLGPAQTEWSWLLRTQTLEAKALRAKRRGKYSRSRSAAVPATGVPIRRKPRTHVTPTNGVRVARKQLFESLLEQPNRARPSHGELASRGGAATSPSHSPQCPSRTARET